MTQQSIRTVGYDNIVRQFVFKVMQGEIPALPDNLNGHSMDCAWLLTQAQKHQDKEPAARANIMQRVVSDYRKRSPSFDKIMLDIEQAGTKRLPTSGFPPLPEDAQLPTGTIATVSPWITKYIEYSKMVSPEGFKDYHIGCALWVLSTVAARRIQVPLSDPVITPLSIVLVGRTSLFAKTTTAKAGIRILKAANLGFLLGADETTPQKLLHKMSGHIPANYGTLQPDRKRLVELRIAMAGQVGWYYDEFNQLINAMTRPGPMAEFAGLLRKLDNCADEYSYETKSGDDHIKNPYLAFLGSTTPANIAKHASRGAEFWNDGMWARMIFIAPHPNDFITNTMTDGIVEPPNELVNALIQWNVDLGVPECWITEVTDDKGNGTGEYTCEVEDLKTHSLRIGEGVIQAFATYRQALRKLIADRNEATGEETQDLDGSYSRLPTIALRIAALIASLEHNGILSMEVWTLAQEIAELFRENLHRLYEQVSQPVEDNLVENTLIDFLKSQGKQVTIRDIVTYGPLTIRKLKSDGIRGLLISLERSGIVTISRDGRKELYSLAS